MDNSQTHAIAYCSDIVRKRDEDRWLASNYARSGEADKLRALYALQCELRHIPAAVSEPQLGEIRLQWWREALFELRSGKAPRKHPVVEAAAGAGLADQAFAGPMDCAIDAAARPLYGEGFNDIDDLTNWLVKSEGAFDALSVLTLGGDMETAAMAQKCGAVFALAREGESLAPDLKTDIAQRVKRQAAGNARALKSAPAGLAPALAHLALTRAYLKRGPAPFPVQKRLRLFSCVAFGNF